MLNCLSRVWVFAILWTVAHQATLFMRFFRQEYWSGLPCPSPEDLPVPGIEPTSLVSCIGRRVLYQYHYLGSPVSAEQWNKSAISIHMVCLQSMGVTKSQTWLGNWKTTTKMSIYIIPSFLDLPPTPHPTHLGHHRAPNSSLWYTAGSH